MCSVKCDRPLSSGTSNRAPTLTNRAHTAVCRWGSATVVTARPLSRVVVSTAGSRRGSTRMLTTAGARANVDWRTLAPVSFEALADRWYQSCDPMLLKKIVIAEDDDAIAHMVNMALGDAGFLCLRARDGEEALRLVKAHDPDLLVLDVMMPRVDGLEVARRLKADVMWSRTPILMLTALAQIDDQVQGLEAGADAYMSKPFDLRELGARVKALIRSSRRERDRSPTTNLPGSRAIDEEIEGALKSKKPTVCVHVDVLNFDSYADTIGIARSEDTVRSLGQWLLDAARVASGGGAFVGHIGGSDFIAVLSPEHVEQFVAHAESSFDAKRATFPGDAASLSLVLAIASTDGLTVNNGPDELGRRLGRAMKAAKAVGKTNHVVWSAS